MKKFYRLLVCTIAFQACGPAWVYAQQQIPVAKEPNAGAGMPQGIKNVARTIGNIFSMRVHPVISSVGSGGGIGAGIGWDFPIKGDWDFTSKAIYTVREAWGLESRIEYEGRRTVFEMYGRLRDLPRTSFYGIGNDSEEADRSAYTFHEGLAGAWGSFRVLPGVTLMARAEHVWPEMSAGEDPKIPSITLLPDATLIPGLEQASRYARYLGAVQLDVPGMVGNGLYQGTTIRGTFSRHDDLELERYNFDRIDFEGQQRFRGIGASHRLTLHGWASHAETDPGQEVPVYLMRTLGSRAMLKSVHEYLLGTDGSQATLRGYNSFRFADRDALLLQAEYRVPIWGPIDATAFYDAGKVASRRADLNLEDLHKNYGFSLSFMRTNSTVARIDIGLGGEGTQWMIAIFTGEQK